MIRKFCDICNSEIEWMINNKVVVRIGEEDTWNNYEYEVCPSCGQKILNFINVLKKNG